MNRTLRLGIHVSIFIVDLNNIKENDVIIEINNDITTSIRDIDQIYFIGDNKLCFILPLTDPR